MNGGDMQWLATFRGLALLLAFMLACWAPAFLVLFFW